MSYTSTEWKIDQKISQAISRYMAGSVVAVSEIHHLTAQRANLMRIKRRQP